MPCRATFRIVSTIKGLIATMILRFGARSRRERWVHVGISLNVVDISQLLLLLSLLVSVQARDRNTTIKLTRCSVDRVRRSFLGSTWRLAEHDTEPVNIRMEFNLAAGKNLKFENSKTTDNNNSFISCSHNSQQPFLIDCLIPFAHLPPVGSVPGRIQGNE